MSRTAERLFDNAKRAPGDSAALVAPLAGLVRALQQQGHLDARAHAAWNSKRLEVSVDPGPQYPIAAITIEAPSSADSAALLGALGLRPGEPAAPGAITSAIERSLRAAGENGHPYASLGVSTWTADSGVVRLGLAGLLGPEVTVSSLRFEGMHTTRQSVAERAVGRLAGRPYQRSAALTGRERLLQLGLFRSVRLEGLSAGNDPAKADLVYRVDEPRYNAFEGAVGFQGDAGTVGLAHLGLANLAGTGRALDLRWASRGPGIADFGARYAEPLLLGAPLRFEAAVQQEVHDTLFTRTQWGGRLQFAITSHDRAEAGFVHERVVEPAGEREESNLENTIFALERTLLDSPLIPRRGIRTRLAGTSVFKEERLRDGSVRSAREGTGEGRFEAYRQLTAATGASLDFRLLGRFSSQRVLPEFERAPIGGATTLRGYDEEAFRVDGYALSRLEWGRFIDAYGGRAFLFWDHAWMAKRIDDGEGGTRLDDFHKDGVGFGLRLRAAGGLVGVDYGLEPGRPPLEGRVHLQLVSSF